jgi:hypothetical protein
MAALPEWVVTAASLLLSLLAVLLMAQAARWFGLGSGYERIRDEAHAIALAEEAECGFDGSAADVDAAGYGAIVRNDRGGMMLVRAHGNRHAARRIDAGFTARLDRNRLMLASGERSFGSVELDFGSRAGVIASRLRTVL